MVRDRLHELKVVCNLRNDDENEISIDINSSTKNKDVAEILNEYDQIRKWLDIVKENTNEMKKYTVEITKSFHNPKNFSEQMNEKREENISVYQKITNKLKILDSELPPFEDCSTKARMKFGLYHGTKEEAFRIWKDYTQFLSSYEDKIKKIISRQAKIVNHAITEDETQQLLDNHTPSLFTGNILQESEKARDNLKELVERYHELEKLENSLKQVKEMFVNLESLIMQQGEVIQSIEFHATRAAMDVDQGTEQLEKAREFKIKALKKKTCILIWITIILVIIVLVLLFT